MPSNVTDDAKPRRPVRRAHDPDGVQKAALLHGNCCVGRIQITSAQNDGLPRPSGPTRTGIDLSSLPDVPIGRGDRARAA